MALGRLRLELSLRVERGEILAVLGPNGAGKTTLLRVLAGLQPLDGGRVVLDGRVLDGPGRHVPAERRDCGVVFQDYLLFPHLSALENVAFGLRARGTGAADARGRALDWLQRLGLGEVAQLRPGRLSGGQAQRVALARALAYEPSLLLLDEPLAALDAGTRGEVRRDLRRVLAGYEGVRLLVTHDPLEAAALADRVLVLEGGRVLQEGTAAEITARPRSAYVAELAGLNLLRGRATAGQVQLLDGGALSAAGAPDGDVFVAFHPRTVALHRRRPEGTPRNVWRGSVAGLERIGERVRVAVQGTPPVVAEVTPAAVAELRLGDGGEVWATVKATEVDAYPA